MIDKQRKLWLMISCHIQFATSEQQDDYAEQFVNRLNQEEVQFCLDFMQHNYDKIR